MSQRFDDCVRPLFVRCFEVGLDCDCIICGINEKKVIDETVRHMFEHHAINPEEMTTCMKLKIRENIHTYRDIVRAQIVHEFSDVSEKLLPVI